MGIKDNLGDFQQRAGSRMSNAAQQLAAARKSVDTAAAKARDLLVEAVEVLRDYEHWANSEGSPALWGVPAIKSHGDEGPRERIGRGWYLGQQLVLMEAGSLVEGGRGHVPIHGDLVAPSALKWGASARAESKRLQRRYAALRADRDQFAGWGFKEGDYYLHFGEVFWPSNARGIVPLAREGWETEPELTNGGWKYKLPIEWEFSAAVKAAQRVRDDMDPARSVFDTSTPDALRPVGCKPGMQIGVFDDGRPVIVEYTEPWQGSFGASKPESWLAWDLEKTLTQRIMCVVEEYNGLSR